MTANLPDKRPLAATKPVRDPVDRTRSIGAIVVGFIILNTLALGAGVWLVTPVRDYFRPILEPMGVMEPERSDVQSSR